MTAPHEHSVEDAAALVMTWAVGPGPDELHQAAQWLAYQATEQEVLRHVVYASPTRAVTGVLTRRELETEFGRTARKVNELVDAASVLLRRFR